MGDDQAYRTDLGKLLFDPNGYWIFDGHGLTVAEQEHVADFIRNPELEKNDTISRLENLIAKTEHL